MSLAVDNQLEIAIGNDFASDAALSRWRNCLPSVLLHHGKACCNIAREWLFATDHSQLNGHPNLMGPRWVRQRYEWGPSQWPMTWCDAVEQESLDCGALAAISREIFASRGVRSHAVQLIQLYTEETASHWFRKWTDHPASTHWIGGALIYHEACAIEVTRNEIKVWDPSAGWWVNSKQFGGYGAVLALRVIPSFQDAATSFNWGEQRLTSGAWNKINSPRRGTRNREALDGDRPLVQSSFMPVPFRSDGQGFEEL